MPGRRRGPCPGACLWPHSALVLVAALALCGLPSPASALPRPEDAVLLVTTTASPAASTSSTPAASLATPGPQPSQEQPAPDAQPKPLPPPPPQVRSLHVLSEVQFRYAHTVVSSRVANPANMSQEVAFSVVLPETAFISSFVMEVDGKAYKAYVKEKEEAKKTYDAAVASGQAAAHVAVSARDSNSFTVALNVEPQNKVSFNLTYEELLTRRLGLYQHVITLNPGQVVRDLEVRVHVKENQKIEKLRVPEFSSGNKIDGDEQACADSAEPQSCTSENNRASITKKSDYEVEVVFRPSEDDQREIMARLAEEKKKAGSGDATTATGGPLLLDAVEPAADGSPVGSPADKATGLNGQFSVQYDVARARDGGEVVVNDGYFVHFFSPSELQPLRKHAIFVLDVSGSMDGRKIEQLREAMAAILDDLKEGDFFNLIAFSSDVKVLNLDKPERGSLYRPSRFHHYGSDPATEEPEQERPPPYRVTKENIDKAKELVKQLSAYGGTNINDALKTALECARDGSRTAALSDAAQPIEPIVLFLTDGDPTVGVTSPSQITAFISELNSRPRSAVFSLAFGEGADIRFLRRLSLANGGFARNIYEAADAAAQLKNFYRQISSPLLANVTFKYIPERVELDSMTTLDFRTLFGGSELVVAGRTSDKGIAELGASVEAVADDGKKASYSSKVIKIDEPLALYPYDVEGPLFNRTVHQEARRASMLERLWAYLTIKQLLDKQDALDASTFKEDVIVPSWARPPPPPPMDPPLPPVALPVGSPGSTTSVPTTAETSADADNSTVSLEPKKRALKLALKYSFVTPLTSLVVVKPNETKATDAQTVNPAEASSASRGSPFLSLSGLGNRHGAYALSAAGPDPFFSYSAPMALPIAQMLPAPPPPPPPPGLPGPPSTPFPGPGGVAWASSSTVYGLEANEPEPVSHALATTTTSTTSASVRIANISEVKWLPENAIQMGSIVLQQDGVNKTFIIAQNETDPEPLQSCQIDGGASSSGICRHFSNCVLSQVTERQEDYMKYQCTLGDYLAICCPPDAQPTSQSSKPSI